MPNTQIPPECTSTALAEYYSSAETQEWFQSLTLRAQRGLASLRILSLPWGICSCGRHGRLYRYTHEEQSVCLIECYLCLRSHLFSTYEVFFDYWFNRPITPQEISRIILPEALLGEHTGTRVECPNCTRYLWHGDDVNVPHNYVNTTNAHINPDRVEIVHERCAFQCRCGQSWATRSSWVREIDGETLCDSCTETALNDGDVAQCEYCGNYSAETTYSYARERTLCQTCYNDSWECDECGVEMQEGYEHECYRENDSVIYHYSYKPTPVFFGNSNYYFGLELEVEDNSGWGCESGAQTVIDKLGNRVYCKSDGSLSEGFEIVSHPHSLEEWQSLDLSVLETLRRRGFRSWDTSTCGIHVHVSRTAFRKNGKRDEGHELRFQKLIYDNQYHVCGIAGRKSSYAQFEDKGKLVPKVKYGQTSARYEAINVENDNTLEVRVFRGSLRPQRVLSAIEFIHSAVEYTRNMKINPKDNQFSWIRFMAYALDNKAKYPNFTQIALKTFDNPRDIHPPREEQD